MGSNVEAFGSLELDGKPETLVVLGSMLARELDRQAGEGRGVNAQLVERYMSVLEVLRGEEAADPIGDLLSKILDESPAGKAKPGRKG